MVSIKSVAGQVACSALENYLRHAKRDGKWKSYSFGKLGTISIKITRSGKISAKVNGLVIHFDAGRALLNICTAIVQLL